MLNKINPLGFQCVVKCVTAPFPLFKEASALYKNFERKARKAEIYGVLLGTEEVDTSTSEIIFSQPSIDNLYKNQVNNIMLIYLTTI